MNLQNDPRLKNMHPLKREILLRLSNSQSTMTPEQMLPQLMEINKELQKRDLSFSRSESEIVLDVLSEGMSPQEKQKINMIKSTQNQPHKALHGSVCSQCAACFSGTRSERQSDDRSERNRRKEQGLPGSV